MNFPFNDADKCVKCALCLPHCPTWRMTLSEGESPRGRIALMQGVAEGKLKATPRLLAHLDGCLGCRACEAVCPAEVPYGKLLDAGREMLLEFGHREAFTARMLARLMRSKAGRRITKYTLLLISGLRGLMPRSLRRLAALLPANLSDNSFTLPHNTSENASSNTVMLFTGCIATILDRETLEDSVAVLTKLGINAVIPETQTCCGALDQHAGRAQIARHLAERNLSAFDTGKTMPILCSASGCGATLLDYARLGESPSAAEFPARVRDISTFLDQLTWPATAKPAALSKRVLVHTPCTLANVMKSAAAVNRLLARIPAIQLLSLSVDTGCCGAAGSYLINQPKMADALAERVATQIIALQPDVIATSNIGCALQLRAVLAHAGLDIPVKHPVSILRGQLEAVAV